MNWLYVTRMVVCACKWDAKGAVESIGRSSARASHNGQAPKCSMWACPLTSCGSAHSPKNHSSEGPHANIAPIRAKNNSSLYASHTHPQCSRQLANTSHPHIEKNPPLPLRITQVCPGLSRTSMCLNTYVCVATHKHTHRHTHTHTQTHIHTFCACTVCFGRKSFNCTT